MQYQVFREQQTSFWHLFQVQGYEQFNLPLCGSISPLTRETTVESKSHNWLFKTQTFWDMSAEFLIWILGQEGVVYFSFSSLPFLFLLHIILSAHVYIHTWRLEGRATCSPYLLLQSFLLNKKLADTARRQGPKDPFLLPKVWNHRHGTPILPFMWLLGIDHISLCLHSKHNNEAISQLLGQWFWTCRFR